MDVTVVTSCRVHGCVIGDDPRGHSQNLGNTSFSSDTVVTGK